MSLYEGLKAKTYFSLCKWRLFLCILYFFLLPRHWSFTATLELRNMKHPVDLTGLSLNLPAERSYSALKTVHYRVESHWAAKPHWPALSGCHIQKKGTVEIIPITKISHWTCYLGKPTWGSWREHCLVAPLLFFGRINVGGVLALMHPTSWMS